MSVYGWREGRVEGDVVGEAGGATAHRGPQTQEGVWIILQVQKEAT